MPDNVEREWFAALKRVEVLEKALRRIAHAGNVGHDLRCCCSACIAISALNAHETTHGSEND